MDFFAVIVCVSGRYTTLSDVFLAVGITVSYFSVSLLTVIIVTHESL
jgi:hypothetical protein